MDDRRFDDLTKFVGHRSSRRAVVKGAAAAALAAAFGRAARGDDTAEAAIYRQGGVKQRVRVYCNQAGQKCKDSKNPTRRCCYRCNGSLTNPNSRCCENEGFACINDSYCCDGRICRDPDLFDGVNLKGCFDGGDLEYGAECQESNECSDNNCLNGICCDEEHTCEYGNTCCTPDEACTEESCCPLENVCITDPYDPSSNECCDQYTEQCTNEDGCCPNALTCYNYVYNTTECCDGFVLISPLARR
jgi:hypothetical protein